MKIHGEMRRDYPKMDPMCWVLTLDGRKMITFDINLLEEYQRQVGQPDANLFRLQLGGEELILINLELLKAEYSGTVAEQGKKSSALELEKIRRKVWRRGRRKG